jgi:hypothetical protein
MADGGTSEFVEQAFKEADAMEIKRIKSHEGIQKILQSSDEAFTTVEIEGVQIRIRSFLTKAIRKKLQLVDRIVASEDIDMDGIETALYEILAIICLDDPYNKILTWKILDEQDKDLAGYLRIMMAKVNEVSRQAKDFRRER